MTKNYFAELADYNNWADSKAIEWLHQITDKQWSQTLPSSFSSIRNTAVHIASAEKIWIDFWTQAPDPVYLSAVFTGTRDELIMIWKQSSAGVRNFIEQLPEEEFQQPVTFRYPRGGEGQLSFSQSFAHLVNHSTYHRGQLVTLLRQAGFTNFSSMDLATYYLIK